MYAVLIALLVLDALVLSAVVLMQAGQGGGLAALGGGPTDAYMGGRQAVTLLTKATWWCGGIFLALSLVLSVMASSRTVGSSGVQELLQQTPTAPPAAAPLPLDAGEPAPAAPAPQE